MSISQPWLHDESLLAVPAGWRRCAWAARMVAQEHGLTVTVSVAWAPPNSWATPALAVGGDVTPSRTLSARRQEIQRHGLRQVSRCAAQAPRFCMACSSAESPDYVRLVSGGTVDVVAMLCLQCEQFSEEHGGDFGKMMRLFDPLAHDDIDDVSTGWGADQPSRDDDTDGEDAPGGWDEWPEE